MVFGKSKGKRMNVDAISTICTHIHTAQLYPQIEASEKISEMSSKFVMISCGDKCEGQKGFQIDGEYFPRILFFDKGDPQKLREDLFNFSARPENKFFYSTAEEVAETMERALNLRNQEL
jgi:hypothetical protein